MPERFDVQVSKEDATSWLVWLNGVLVGRFPLVGDALAYASLLECNPRERAATIAA